jgi:hypothetical protein
MLEHLRALENANTTKVAATSAIATVQKVPSSAGTKSRVTHATENARR